MKTLKIKGRHVAILSLVMAIVILLFVAYNTLLPTIIVGDEQYLEGINDWPTGTLISEITGRVTLDRTSYDENHTTIKLIDGNIKFDFTNTEMNSNQYQGMNIFTHYHFEFYKGDDWPGILIESTPEEVFKITFTEVGFKDAHTVILDYSGIEVTVTNEDLEAYDYIWVWLIVDGSYQCFDLNGIYPDPEYEGKDEYIIAHSGAELLWPEPEPPPDEPPIDDFLTDISGTVQDTEGNKLGDVKCEALDGTIAISESDGHFDLQGIPYNWTVTFTKEGYETETAIGSGPSLSERITMQESEEPPIDEEEEEEEEEAPPGTEEGIPAGVIISIIFAIPFTILMLGIQYGPLPIRLVIVLIVDSVIAIYIIFFSGVM